MFNLGALLQVSALTMGVASATPICNAPEKAPYTQQNETQVNEYTLSFSQVNYTSQSYNEYFNQQYTDTETKANYQVSSNYVNVIASRYMTIPETTINDTNCLGYLNELQARNLNNKDYNERVLRATFVIQITPYNYNIDTDIAIRMGTEIGVLTDQYNYEIFAGSKYLNKTVYTTFQDDWSNYLNRTITKFQCSNVIKDIENINNNFYYNKVKQHIELNSNNVNQQGYYNDETIINLTPKTTNYIVLDYVISCYMYEYDPFNDIDTQLEEEMVFLASHDFSFSNPTINGTNIIPEGTYEVIDIPGLMWEILTMPFAFISQAFNLTLFPGTPYQVNISNLFLSIIAIVVFIWLITFFLKLKG